MVSCVLPTERRHRRWLHTPRQVLSIEKYRGTSSRRPVALGLDCTNPATVVLHPAPIRYCMAGHSSLIGVTRGPYLSILGKWKAAHRPTH